MLELKLYIFRAEYNLWGPYSLDWCSQESKHKNGREIQFGSVHCIDPGTTSLPDITSFHSILKATLWSIIQWFDPPIKRTSQAVQKLH